MIGIVLCGHGNYAQGVLDSLVCITGELNNIRAITFDTSRDETVFEEVLQCTIDDMNSCNIIIIACDLCGGTPYKMAIKLSLQNKTIQVVGGINLAFLIELALKKDYDDAANIEEMIKEARQQMNLFMLPEDDVDEED